MIRPVRSRRPPETEADRYWREKHDACPRCWRPLALVLCLCAVALVAL